MNNHVFYGYLNEFRVSEFVHLWKENTILFALADHLLLEGVDNAI